MCGEIIGMARGWNCSLVGFEDGLGRLRSGGKNRSLNRLINGWARSVLINMLARRCRLAGIETTAVWGAYSTTIGNMCFAAPDACAAAAEIARRAIAWRVGVPDSEGSGRKVGLPVFEACLIPNQWKEEVSDVQCWKAAHGVIKKSKSQPGPGWRVGRRRLHYDTQSCGARGRMIYTLSGHARTDLGGKNRPGSVMKRAMIRLEPTRFCT